MPENMLTYAFGNVKMVSMRQSWIIAVDYTTKEQEREDENKP
jgi:hypothetical protein